MILRTLFDRRQTGTRARKAWLAALVLGGLSLNSVAHAHDRHHGPRFARVIDVQPVYSYVNVRVPRQVCRGGSYGHGHNATGTIVGGIVGGVIGNSLSRNTSNRPFRHPGHGNRGHNRGNFGATVAGAVIGAAIGSELSHSTRHRPHVGRHCVNVVDTQQQRRFEHFRVTYVFDGRRYTTQRQRDPGRRIEVAHRPQRPHRH